MLGETFACRSGNIVFVGEQVSHHPPITAYHFEHVNHDVSFDGTANIGATFFGNSVGVEVKGASRLRVNLSSKTKSDKSYLLNVLNEDETAELRTNDCVDDKNSNSYEDYIFDPPLPKGYAKGLLFGGQRYELGGKTAFVCKKSGLMCSVEFFLSKLFNGKRNRVKGKITSIDNDITHFTFSGEWDKIINLNAVSKEAKKVMESMFPDGIIHDFKKVPLPPTFREFSAEDALSTSSNVVWKDVFKNIIANNYAEADKEKNKVEVSQRAYIAKLSSDDTKHEHRYFEADEEFLFLLRKDFSDFGTKPLVNV